MQSILQKFGKLIARYQISLQFNKNRYIGNYSREWFFNLALHRLSVEMGTLSTIANARLILDNSNFIFEQFFVFL